MNKLENKNRQNRVPLSPQKTEAQRFALGFFRTWMSGAQLKISKELEAYFCLSSDYFP